MTFEQCPPPTLPLRDQILLPEEEKEAFKEESRRALTGPVAKSDFDIAKSKELQFDSKYLKCRGSINVNS
jgi:hypothetical protein